MESDLEKRVVQERASIAALDSMLDSTRTPYLKRQLRFAGHMLDDTVDAMRLAAAHPNHHAMWIDFAQMNFQTATQLRQHVKAAVDKYGGPERVMEIGG